MTDDRIEKAIRQNNVRLMIMDPIQAYLGANVDMNRANEIRPLFRHLSTIAERTGCAIVLIGHLNKSSGSQSDYRSLGSIDIAAAVRSILFVEKVEKEKEQDIRVVYQQKDSLAKKENPVAFSLGEEGLKWLGEFKAYTYGVGDAVAKGGRYDNLLKYFGKEAPAIGFVIVVDDLLEALARQKKVPRLRADGVLIIYEEGRFRDALKKAKELRAQQIPAELIPAIK